MLGRSARAAKLQCGRCSLPRARARLEYGPRPAAAGQRRLSARPPSPPPPTTATSFAAAQGGENNTFVSKHARLEAADVTDWLKEHKFGFHDSAGVWVRVRECPFCHPHKNKEDNFFKLHINKAPARAALTCSLSYSEDSMHPRIRKERVFFAVGVKAIEAGGC